MIPKNDNRFAEGDHAHIRKQTAPMTSDKVNILLVDDQPSKLLTYEVILRELGENLIKASSGKEALEQLLKNEIAVVLMDVSMLASRSDRPADTSFAAASADRA